MTNDRGEVDSFPSFVIRHSSFENLMKRPWQVWLAFLACGVVVAAAMGWLTVHALRADHDRSVARAEADLEQRVSLALWRMDTKLAPMIAEESARPHFYYAPFFTLQDRARGVQLDDVEPSPLLGDAPTNILLNFDATESGKWQSPQAPPPELTDFACANGMTVPQIEFNRQQLEELAASINVAELLAQLPDQPLPQLVQQFAQGLAANREEQVAEAGPQQGQASFYQNYGYGGGYGGEFSGAPNGPPQAADAEQAEKEVDDANPFGEADAPQQAASKPISKSIADFGSRAGRQQRQVQQEFIKQRAENPYWRLSTANSASAPVVENVSRPVWVGDQLVIARRVVRDGQTVVQGSWIDWPRLKTELLAETADLTPGADLAPVRTGEEPDPTRMLAGLPVRLVTAPLAVTTGAAPPLRWALGFGWAALALALAAVAGLLWGVLALSERRAAFVSSVTHELRTPLTTFRMYAEMLAKEMLPTPERRREYLETLRTEAERLTHLVENVLAYARLERGRRPRRTERTTPQAIVERFEPRLAERAAQSQMQLECKVDGASRQATLVTDVGVVEQILFNLVDNAAKYAARAADRRIHLDVTRDARCIAFTVRDHGPGFASVREAERSAPFSKSAQQAAESAPGVGLGLALCRRLARELGGSLQLATANGPTPGAIVTLRLPLH
jgi:signal transduction histidine kinase